MMTNRYQVAVIWEMRVSAEIPVEVDLLPHLDEFEALPDAQFDRAVLEKAKAAAIKVLRDSLATGLPKVGWPEGWRDGEIVGRVILPPGWRQLGDSAVSCRIERVG